jgi:hypothetical protein
MDLPLVAVHGEASRPDTIRAEAREVDLQRRSVGVTVFYPDSPARLNFAVPWGRNETVAVLKNHHAISSDAGSAKLAGVD